MLTSLKRLRPIWWGVIATSIGGVVWTGLQFTGSTGARSETAIPSESVPIETVSNKKTTSVENPTLDAPEQRMVNIDGFSSKLTESQTSSNAEFAAEKSLLAESHPIDSHSSDVTTVSFETERNADSTMEIETSPNFLELERKLEVAQSTIASLTSELEQSEVKLHEVQEKLGQAERDYQSVHAVMKHNQSRFDQIEEKLQQAIESQASLKKTAETLENRNRQLAQENAKHKAAIPTFDSSILEGKWKLRVNVEGLVGASKVEIVDWVIDYDIWMDIDGSDIQGGILGVKEVHKPNNKLRSTASGKIAGKIKEAGEISLWVGEPGKPPASIYELKMVDGKLVGRLDVGTLPKDWQGYAGDVIGTRVE